MSEISEMNSVSEMNGVREMSGLSEMNSKREMAPQDTRPPSMAALKLELPILLPQEAAMTASVAASCPPAVLLVHDNAGPRSIFATLLRIRGCHVVQAASLEEALAQARAIRRLDLILISASMQDGKGATLAQSLRRHRAAVPITLLMGFAGENAPETPWPMLHMPYTPAKLAALLEPIGAGTHTLHQSQAPLSHGSNDASAPRQLCPA